MTKVLPSIGALALIAIYTTTISAASLSMRLEADQVGAGNEYDVRIFATVSGTVTTNSGGGLHSLSFDVVSADSSGVTDAKDVAGFVVTTWNTEITSEGFILGNPTAFDIGGDGDIDALDASFGYFSGLDFGGVNFELGLTEILVATQRWIMNLDGPATLELQVSDLARWADLTSGSVSFGEFGAENISATGVVIGVPEPASAVLAALALVMLYVTGRRRQRLAR